MSLDLGLPPQPEIFFFALRPDPAAAREMIKVGKWCRERYGLSARLYGLDRLHVSLAPAVSRRGFRKDDVAAAVNAAACITADPFTVTFSRICTLGGRDKRPVVLCCDDGVAALTTLRNTLRDELVKVGLWHGSVQFRPHVTLFWDRCRVPEANLKAPIRWTVEEFVLVQSMIGRSRHVDLARWPLRDRLPTG
jgi:2'-5' RNA ligase